MTLMMRSKLRHVGYDVWRWMMMCRFWCPSPIGSKREKLQRRSSPIRDRYLPYRATRSTPNRSHVSHSSNKTGKWNFANFQLVRAKSLQSRRRPTKTKENDRTCFVHLLLKESLRKHHSKESLQTARQLECKGTKEGTEWKRQR